MTINGAVIFDGSRKIPIVDVLFHNTLNGVVLMSLLNMPI